MNVVILDPAINLTTTLTFENAIDAHLRNSITISEYLKCDILIMEKDFNEAFEKKYDVIVLGYATRYAPFQLINKLIDKNPKAKKIVISNEYNTNPSVGGFRPYELIANYEKSMSDKSELKRHFLNLNLLFAKEPNEIKEKKYDCIYFGTYRVNRTEYFKKYLQEGIYLSTSPRNFKKYKHIGCNPKYITKLTWKPKRETLNLFKYQLYIEDVETHTNFNNLANRYYEAGFCNNVVFFDVNCRNTINKSELKDFKDQVEFYIVSSHKELQQKIKECNKDFNKHLAIQKGWRVSEQARRNDMLKELKSIIYEQK